MGNLKFLGGVGIIELSLYLGPRGKTSPHSPTFICLFSWEKTSGRSRIWRHSWQSVTQAWAILQTLKILPTPSALLLLMILLKKIVWFLAKNLGYFILSKRLRVRRSHLLVLKTIAAGVMPPVWLAPLSLWRSSTLQGQLLPGAVLCGSWGRPQGIKLFSNEIWNSIHLVPLTGWGVRWRTSATVPS